MATRRKGELVDIEEEEVDQDHRLNAIEKAVASLESQLIADKEVVKRLIERVQQPTNWIALVSAAVVMFGAMVAFVKLQTGPIETNQVRLIDLHDKLETRVFDTIKDEARLEQKVEDNEKADLERARYHEAYADAKFKDDESHMQDLKERVRQDEDQIHRFFEINKSAR